MKSVEKKLTSAQYYKGGFDAGMTRREVALILGVYSSTPKSKIKDKHKKLMISNHPDRGGSPYLASKISECISTLIFNLCNFFLL